MQHKGFALGLGIMRRKKRWANNGGEKNKRRSDMDENTCNRARESEPAEKAKQAPSSSIRRVSAARFYAVLFRTEENHVNLGRRLLFFS